MASHQLIDAHLNALARRLPPDAVDELADGLTETWQHHLAAGLSPTDAARVAITEFGSVDQIAHAFVVQSPSRRTARRLLATGPLVGVCWGTTLVVAHAWNWPVPPPAAALLGIALLAVVATLITSATSRHSYRRARLGDAGGLGLVALDVVMVAAILLAAPTPVWPMLVAVPVSLARIGLTLRSLPAGIAH
ncbi:permease prefix domain 1-containing protein [Micromonospora echinaurantiaca]|uniref:permease prefix domain 1-containing protein n=1 Tax=Micromonospora echinaurantiaca TaxID=47857 RepID=UPI0037B09087